MPSPYDGVPVAMWLNKTRELVAAHPLKPVEIVEAVLQAWQGIFASKIGMHGARIGRDIYPSPQILGALLHELIPFEIAAKYPKIWRRDASSDEKDLVCIRDVKFSTEVKTSSHKNRVFGNRSYAQEGASAGKKGKSGYYITVNFEKCKEGMSAQPQVRLIRFGWLDHTDWKAQTSATGQQASLRAEAYSYKLLPIYDSAKDTGDSICDT